MIKDFKAQYRTVFVFAVSILFVTPRLPAKQSLSNFKYKAAGVLPIYKHGEKKWVLLGRERSGNDAGTYDSFAGSRDPDERDPITTAARECVEEMITYQTINKDIHYIRKYIDPRHQKTELVLADHRKKYVLFIVNFDQYIDRIKQNFPVVIAKKRIPRKYREKDQLAFVEWTKLQKASQIGSPVVQAWVQIYNQTEHTVELKKQEIVIRPILAYMLRLHFNQRPYMPGFRKKIHFYM